MESGMVLHTGNIVAGEHSQPEGSRTRRDSAAALEKGPPSVLEPRGFG